MVNLGDAEGLEWAVAAWACVCALVLSYSLPIFRAACLEHVEAARSEPPQEEVKMTYRRTLGVCVLWGLLVAVFAELAGPDTEFLGGT